MALFQVLARIGAAGALALAVLAPIASADDRGRGDRGGYHDRGDRGDRGHRGRGNRGGDWKRGHRGDRDWKRGRHHDRDWDRGRRHHDRKWNRGHHARRGYGVRHHRNRNWHRARRHHIKRHYSPPRVINRYYYSRPAYGYRARPRVSFHYTTGYYHDGYRIGSRYSYRPNTIIITDYDRYGLYRPPHGHHWVRDPHGDDAVLASVATGAIIGLAVGILSH